MLTKTLLVGLLGSAVADFEVDLRLMLADDNNNGTDGNATTTTTAAPTTTPAPANVTTTPPPTNNTGKNETGKNNTAGGAAKDAAGAADNAEAAAAAAAAEAEKYDANSTVRVDFGVPQEVDLGLGNATDDQVASALNVLCKNEAFQTAQKEGIVGALSTFEGLLVEHITSMKCAQSAPAAAAALRALTAASGKTAIDVQFRMDAPKTAAFAQHLEQSLQAGESLETIVAKEVVKKLVAEAATIAGFSAQAMKDAAADPGFKTALLNAGLPAATVDAVVAAAAVAVVDVKADQISAETGAGAAVSNADAVAHTSRAPSTSSSTSGAGAAFGTVFAAFVTGAVLF